MKQLWRDRTSLELNSAWTAWSDRGECFHCGNDSVDIRKTRNAQNPGHAADNPHTRSAYFYRFTCRECKYTWMNMPVSIDA